MQYQITLELNKTLENTSINFKTEFGEFYAFEALTIAPISTTIVKKELLENSQIQWLNDYNALVFEKLSPFLTEEENQWLKNETAAI